MLQETKVTINYDDQPEWVAESFIAALGRLGISIEIVSDPNETKMTYLLKAPTPK